MPDLTLSAASIAASGATYTTLALVGIPAPLAMPLAIAAATGATFAMTHQNKGRRWTAWAAFSAFSSWLFSCILGVIGGVVFAPWLLSMLPSGMGATVSNGAASIFCALITGALGITHILPWIIALGAKKVESQS